MLRKLLLTSVAALGLLSPLAVTSEAGAHEFRPERRQEHRHGQAYRVFYHDPCRPGWICAGTFGVRWEAERFAERFSCQGFAISIR